MLISERICMPILFFLEVPPCSLESVSVCPRKLLPWLLLPSRSRLWLPQNVNTLCGLEDLFLPLCLLSKVCGSARKNMMNLAHPLSTASASKHPEEFQSCLELLSNFRRKLLCAYESSVFLKTVWVFSIQLM